MDAPVATEQEIAQSDEHALEALDAYLRPELDWRGYVGIGLVVAAALLVWRLP